ncbi:restriction endonuclease subunit S [Flavobacterium sp. TAB 87]|uniref:restriction endonuclease subunit S n=1 Tax=Flavobacterium sp. TAB 87 TaxID=1729581 RepID=UPI00076DF2DC|nr:restriction endonuclease subunit S [Flavobacterium sp. TAB 87]KVV16025.1 Type I restriction enzyme EcoKI specificity protein [Flavobacterium sp. TAB 87]
MIVDLNYVPKGWKKIKIPKVLFFQEGPGVRNWQFTETGVKLLNVGNINLGKIDLSKTSIHLSDEEANGKYKHFLVDDGDLLIACSGIVVDNFHNKIAFAKKEHLPLCLNTSTMRFKALNDKVDLNYFKYYLQTVHFTAQLRKLITGSAQLNFGPSHIKKIDLLLPPLETQKHIAQIQDDAAALRDKTEQLLKEYDALAQSIFLDMFGDPVINPQNWEKRKLKNGIINLQSGLSLSGEERDLKEGEIAVLKISAITTGEFINTEYKVVDKTNISKFLVFPKKGDLLFSRANTKEKVGAIATVDRDYNNIFIPDKLWRIDTNHLLNKTFLKFILSHSGFRYNIEKVSTGTSGSMVNISMSKFLKIEAPFPPIDLQKQFAEKIILIEKQKELAKQELQESHDLFNCLLQKAFKGELV